MVHAGGAVVSAVCHAALSHPVVLHAALSHPVVLHAAVLPVSHDYHALE